MLGKHSYASPSPCLGSLHCGVPQIQRIASKRSRYYLGAPFFRHWSFQPAHTLKSMRRHSHPPCTEDGGFYAFHSFIPYLDRRSDDLLCGMTVSIFERFGFESRRERGHKCVEPVPTNRPGLRFKNNLPSRRRNSGNPNCPFDKRELFDKGGCEELPPTLCPQSNCILCQSGCTDRLATGLRAPFSLPPLTYTATRTCSVRSLDIRRPYSEFENHSDKSYSEGHL